MAADFVQHSWMTFNFIGLFVSIEWFIRDTKQSTFDVYKYNLISLLLRSHAIVI